MQAVVPIAALSFSTSRRRYLERSGTDCVGAQMVGELVALAQALGASQ